MMRSFAITIFTKFTNLLNFFKAKKEPKKYRCHTCNKFVKNSPFDSLHPMVEQISTLEQFIFFCEGDRWGLIENPNYQPSPEIKKLEKAIKKLKADLHRTQMAS